MSDEQPVLAPNATVVNNIEKDPPWSKPEAVFPVEGETGYILVRQGYSLEEVEPAREGVACHRFSTVVDLADYLERNHTDEAAETDIIVERGQVHVTIGPKRAEPQTLSVSLDSHPSWKAWMGLTGGDITQRTLIQHCRAWKETLIEGDSLLQALGTIQVVGGSKVTSTMDETGATRLVAAEDSKDLSVKIPPTILFDTPVYDGIANVDDGEATYTCEMFLSVDVDAPVSFTFDFPKHGLIEKAARREVAAYLQRLLGEEWLVSVGGSSHSQRNARG